MRAADKWLVALAFCLGVVSAVFLTWPGLDLSTSALFWNGRTFLFAKNGVGAFFTVYLHYGMRLAFFAYVAMGGLALATDRAADTIRGRDYLFIVGSVALAAGLITNVVLKDHWGRARPNQIVQFGGTQHFTPAWIISDQCGTNCSFVGGDVSFAFCALAFALVARRHKPALVVASVAFGMLVALGRIAAGAHFLSDCLVAALLTSVVVLLLYRLTHVRYFP